jgi:hypothetical protein
VWPLYVVTAGTVAGLAMIVWSVRRAQAPAWRDGAMRTSIAELAVGRFRVVGRVVPIWATASEIDGEPCVYVERAHYAPVGGGIVPLLREVEHAWAAHPFYLDDGSGRLRVDPADALIECATATGDGGLVAERRLRAGEEIELVARFRPADAASAPELDEGPYRGAAGGWEAAPDDAGPPRISYRTEPGMEPVGLDEVSSFLRGAGLLMMATSLLFGGAMLWLGQWIAPGT